MSAAEFRAWRKQLSLTQREAAAALGLSLSQVSDYESGLKRGTDRPAIIPRTVALACRAISGGLSIEET
jgi:transcriptional regulator with XRE-family HTH domain